MMDPRRMLFDMSKPRPIRDDPDEEGLNCAGCLFERQRASVCKVASEEAIKRGMRDCDAIDQFGEVIIYLRVAVDPRQIDMIDELQQVDR